MFEPFDFLDHRLFFFLRFLLNQGPAFLFLSASLNSWHCSCPAPLVHVWMRYDADNRVSSTSVRAGNNRTVSDGLLWKPPVLPSGRACTQTFGVLRLHLAGRSVSADVLSTIFCYICGNRTAAVSVLVRNPFHSNRRTSYFPFHGNLDYRTGLYGSWVLNFVVFNDSKNHPL